MAEEHSGQNCNACSNERVKRTSKLMIKSAKQKRKEVKNYLGAFRLLFWHPLSVQLVPTRQYHQQIWSVIHQRVVLVAILQLHKFSGDDIPKTTCLFPETERFLFLMQLWILLLADPMFRNNFNQVFVVPGNEAFPLTYFCMRWSQNIVNWPLVVHKTKKKLTEISFHLMILCKNDSIDMHGACVRQRQKKATDLDSLPHIFFALCVMELKCGLFWDSIFVSLVLLHILCLLFLVVTPNLANKGAFPLSACVLNPNEKKRVRWHGIVGWHMFTDQALFEIAS